ncbi:extracellular solute-binding protein [Nocardiopsis halotolerans]|uniref:extracellular solute-binding protein n=1 Tax=Nocardiopsis halotolerans TaxID=124252 RepID=UPI00034BD4D8|nr:extracellular solute-binding protein [Nocardiopsis halotolerans]
MRDATPHPPPRSGPVGPDRRSFLGLAAAGLVAAGCAPPDTLLSARTPIHQWNLFAGGDGMRMIEMHEAYRAEHPGTDLSATTFEWGEPFYTKVAMGAAGGRGADIATVHVSRLESLAPGRLLDPIDPAELAEAGIDSSVFLPNVWEQCFFEGQLYAIPLDTHVLVQFHNLDVCRQAGLLDADDRLVPLEGLDTYLDALREIRAVTGAYGLSLDTWGPWSNFWALYRQQDGELLFGEDDYEWDEDKAMAAMEVLYRLSEEGLAPRVSQGADTSANLANGRAGLMIHGNWEMATLNAAGTPFSASQFPNLFGNHRTRGDSHCYVLPHRRDRSPARTRAALEYAAWMLRHSLTWAEGAGHIPAYRPVVESPEYDALHPQAEYREAAENVQFEPKAWFSGSAGRLQDEATGPLTGLHQGTQTPDEALEQLKRTFRTLIDVPSPV